MGKESKEQEEQDVPKVEPTVKEVAKINAIRDIIFGTDMAEYDEQFNNIRLLINDNKQHADNDKQELLDTIQALENKITQSMQSLEERMVERLDKLQHEKTDREVLGSLLEEIGKKIKQ